MFGGPYFGKLYFGAAATYVLASGAMAATINGTSGGSGAITGSGAIVITASAGTGAVSATLGGKVFAIATIPGTAAGSAAITASGALVDTIAGISGGSAAMTGKGAIACTIAGTGGGFAAMGGNRPFDATISATAGGSAAITGQGAVAGTISGVAGGSAAMTGKGAIADTIAGVAAGSVTVTGAGQLAATIAGVGAIPKAYFSLKATINGTSVCTAQVKTATIAATINGFVPFVYSSKHFDFSAQFSALRTMFFSSDGSRLFVISGSSVVYQYNLSTAWDISSASYSTLSFSLASQDTNVRAICFSADGSKMYATGDTNKTIFQYTLSTPWDLSTISYASKSFVSTGQGITPRGTFISNDGSTFFLIDAGSGSRLFQYTLSTPYDISTASYASKMFAAQDDIFFNGIFFSSDGLQLFLSDINLNTVGRYVLASAFDLSTVNIFARYDASNEEFAARGLFFTPDLNTMFISGGTNNGYQYLNGARASIIGSQINSIINGTSGGSAALAIVAATINGTSGGSVNVLDSGGYDSDAQTYFTADTGLTTAQKNAVNKYIVGLKDLNAWTGSKAWYFFLGGSAANNGINARQPGTFDLTFMSTPWTHASAGSTFVAANGCYAKTGFVPSVNGGATAALGFLSRTNAAQTGADIGATDGTSREQMYVKYTDNLFYGTITNVYVSQTIGDTRGLFILSREDATNDKAYQNGVFLANQTTSVSGQPQVARELYLEANNSSGSPSEYGARGLFLVFITDGLTQAQVEGIARLTDDFEIAIYGATASGRMGSVKGAGTSGGSVDVQNAGGGGAMVASIAGTAGGSAVITGKGAVAGTINAFNPPAYSGRRYNTSGQNGTPQGLFFYSDGTKAYFFGNNATIYQLALSTAWDITTAAYTGKSFSISTQNTAGYGIDFSPDGTKLFVIGIIGTRTVYQYTLSTPWDISTASYASKSFSLPNGTIGVKFSADGAKMFTPLSTSGGIIHYYNLSSAFDVTTAVDSGITYNVNPNSSDAINTISFNSTGLSFYVFNQTRGLVQKFTLSSAYDLSTMSLVGVSSYGSTVFLLKDFFVSAAEDRIFYTSVSGTGSILQYDSIFTNNVITGAGSISSTASGTGDASAAITGSGAIAATIPGTSGGSAAITGAGSMAAIINGTSGGSAHIDGTGGVSATIDGTSGGSAILTGDEGSSATINGTSGGSAAITGAGRMAATISGTATIDAEIIGFHAGGATIEGTSDGSATLTGKGAIAANISGTAGGTGSFGASAQMSATINGTAGGTAAITAKGKIQATINGSAAITATLFGVENAFSVGGGVAGGHATIKGAGVIAGTVNGTAGGSATISDLEFVSAVVPGAAGGSANLIGAGKIAALISGTSGGSAETGSEIAINSTIDGTAGGYVNLIGTGYFSALIEGISGTLANVINYTLPLEVLEVNSFVNAAFSNGSRISKDLNGTSKVGGNVIELGSNVKKSLDLSSKINKSFENGSRII